MSDITYTKRDDGAYYVAVGGERIGWVKRDHVDPRRWNAWTTSWDGPFRGVLVANCERTRNDAVYELLGAVKYNGYVNRFDPDTVKGSYLHRIDRNVMEEASQALLDRMYA